MILNQRGLKDHCATAHNFSVFFLPHASQSDDIIEILINKNNPVPYHRPKLTYQGASVLAGHSIRVTYTSTILAVADRIFFLERSFIVGVDYDAKALIEQCYLDCKLDIRFMTTKALNFARQDKDTRQSLTLKPYLSTQLSLPKKLCKRHFKCFVLKTLI